MAAEAPPPTFGVRTARTDDIDQILDLFEAVAAEGRWIGAEAPVDRPGRLALLRSTIEAGPGPKSPSEPCASTPVTPQAVYYVAEAGAAVIGQLSMELKPYNVAELGMLVAPEWRGRGVGSALVDAGLGWARTVGAHKVALQFWPHNHAARALYLKFGFVQEGLLRRHYRRRNGELWDAVVMGLVLDETSPGCSLAEHYPDVVAKSGGPIRSHSTDTSTKQWSGSKMQTKLGDAGARELRQAHAWVDPDADPDAKTAYKFVHHEIGGGGKVGAASVRACRTGIAVLNGGRGGADVPASDRKGIYNHLARHMRDAGEDPPELK